MRKVMKIIIVFFFLIFFLLCLYLAYIIYKSRTQTSVSYSPKSFIIELKSDPLGIKRISASENNPDQYKLSYYTNYYTIQLVDSKNNILFSADVPKKSRIIYESFSADKASAPVVEENEPVLYFPYFTDASIIKFLDERSVVIAQFDLRDFLIQ